MFSLAFSPDGSRLYVSFTDASGPLHVVEYLFLDCQVRKRSRRGLLTVPQPSVLHHGGNLAVGPDGLLWIGLGDGSLGFDPTDEAQSLDSLLGKLLRIDPRASMRKPYRVPPSNPFANRPGARPEIYAYGLRNPWRFSIDRLTGDLWLGDVGQYVIEEIDFLPSGTKTGANFGWNRLEGTRRVQGQPPRDHVQPLHQYNHDDGRCAVIGGYVYRGSRIPELFGAYLYGDFCDGEIRALVRRRRAVLFDMELGPQLQGLVSFGEGADGEIYVLSLLKGVYQLEPKF